MLDRRWRVSNMTASDLSRFNNSAFCKNCVDTALEQLSRLDKSPIAWRQCAYLFFFCVMHLIANNWVSYWKDDNEQCDTHVFADLRAVRWRNLKEKRRLVFSVDVIGRSLEHQQQYIMQLKRRRILHVNLYMIKLCYRDIIWYESYYIVPTNI